MLSKSTNTAQKLDGAETLITTLALVAPKMAQTDGNRREQTNAEQVLPAKLVPNTVIVLPA